MKKKLNLLLTTILSAFVLTSCSNSDNEILKNEKFHIPAKNTSIGVSNILASTGTKSFDITKENGDSSTSCLGENLGCVSIQSFCCS